MVDVAECRSDFPISMLGTAAGMRSIRRLVAVQALDSNADGI